MPITRENLDGDDYRASGFVLHLNPDFLLPWDSVILLTLYLP